VVRATARVEQAPEDAPDIHPNIAEIYKAKVTQLGEALADPELRDQAAEAIRALADEVVLEPDDKRGEVNATLRGEVMNILDIVSERETRNGPGMTAARGNDTGNQSEFNPHAASALRDADCAVGS
jgi:hypothetical protein